MAAAKASKAKKRPIDTVDDAGIWQNEARRSTRQIAAALAAEDTKSYGRERRSERERPTKRRRITESPPAIELPANGRHYPVLARRNQPVKSNEKIVDQLPGGQKSKFWVRLSNIYMKAQADPGCRAMQLKFPTVPTHSLTLRQTGQAPTGMKLSAQQNAEVRARAPKIASTTVSRTVYQLARHRLARPRPWTSRMTINDRTVGLSGRCSLDTLILLP